MLTFGKTSLGTSGSYCLVDNLGVTERVNGYGISGKLCATYGTVNYVIVATVSLTSRINVVLYNGVACGVTECCYSFLCNECLATYGTVLTLGKTGLGTGGSYCLVDNLGMTECVGMIVNVAVATYGTGVSGVTCSLTGRRGYYCIVGVTKSRYLISSIRIVTYGTSISGVACSGTSGSSYYCTIVVTKCIYGFLRNDSLATYGAMLTFGKTVLGTGGSYCLVDNLGVTERIGMIVNIVVTAY